MFMDVGWTEFFRKIQENVLGRCCEECGIDVPKFASL
jgi:hypothetical protein